MSAYTESLLRKYNKHLQPTAKTETDDENKKKFVTSSYVNTYDALYDKYSQDPNFNTNMWQNAVALGEQDRYIALLDGNKDKQLSAQFYDPEYYDYEAMMLELSLPYADNEKKAMRYQDVFNNATGEWEEVEIGEMTDNEYYRHLLNENRTAQSEQITKSLEQWRKEQLTTMQKFWSGVGATAGEFGEGLLTGLTGIIDLVASPFAASGMAWSDGVGGQNWLDAFVNYFGEHSLTALERKTVRAALDEYERLNTTFRDIDGNIVGIGKYCAGIANSIGMMIPAIVANLATGGAASLSWVGTAAFSASIFSGNMYENATNKELVGSPSWVKITNAVVKTGAEALIEYALGKFLGGTIQNQAIGLTGTFSKLGAGLGKDAGIRYLFKSAGQEGLEEFLQDFSTNCIDQFYAIWNEGYGNNGVTFQTLVDSFILGSLSSIFMSGFSAYVSQPIMSGIDKKRGRLTQWDVVELEPGKTTKLKGLTRMAYGDMVSNFQKAIEELKSGKLSMRKNLKLAEQVNAGLSVISQFYSSLSEERIKSCELLLDRIVKADQRRTQRESEYYIGTKAQIKSDRQTYEKEVTTATTQFGQHVENLFNISVLTASVIHKKNEAEKVAKAADKVDETLKEGNVTKSEFVADKDGNVYGQDEEGRKFEDAFSKKAQDTFEKLRKEFDWAFVTDGYTAAEADNCLFVPKAWLQNYEASEIYKFLEQTQVLDRLVEMTKKGSKLYNLKFAQMVNRLVDVDAKFTKQKNLTKKSALMDLLFNESVYQYFLLSQRDKYFDDIKGFIFTLHDTVNGMIEESKYYQQKRKGALMQTRMNMRKKIYDEIRNTMKRPTMKAIINWRIPPQDVGADSVFGPKSAELKFINAYKAQQKILRGGPKGPNKQAFMNLKEELLDKLQERCYNQEEYDQYANVIENGLKDDASIDERTTAVGMLDMVERAVTADDTMPPLSIVRGTLKNVSETEHTLTDLMFVEGAEAERYFLMIDTLNNMYTTFVSQMYGDNTGIFPSIENDVHRQRIFDALIDFRNELIGNKSVYNSIQKALDALEFVTFAEDDFDSTIVNAEFQTVLKHLRTDKDYDSFSRDIDELINIIYRGVEHSVAELATPWQEYKNQLIELEGELSNKNTTRQKKLGFGMLQIPYQVMNLVENGDAAGAQFVTDKLDEFEKTYGIPARQMLMGDLVGMSLDQRNQLTRDMELLKVDMLHMFVLRKLEHMLGDDYMVTLAANQTGTDEDFSVVEFDNKIFDADYDKLYDRLDSLNAERIAWFDKVHRVISNLKSEEKANDYIEEFLDILSALDSPYSDFKEYVPSDLSIFSKELNKKFLTTNRDVLSWLMANKGRIENIFETMRQNIDDAKAGYSSSNNAERLSLELDKVRTLVKKIKNALQRSGQKSSDALFNWLTEFYKTANLLFSTADEYKPLLKDYQRNWIKSLSLQISKSGNDRKALEIIVAKANDIYDFYEELLSQIPIESSQSSQEQMGEPAPDKFTDFVITKAISSDVILPKEVFDMTIEEQNDMLYNLSTTDRRVTIADILDLSMFPELEELAKLCTVRYEERYDEGGHYDPALNEIVITTGGQVEGYVHVFMHEFKHFLQNEYNLPNGFNTDTAKNMPDFLLDVANHHRDYVNYVYDQKGLPPLPDGEITDETFRKYPMGEQVRLKEILAFAAYMLVQGEIQSRAYIHNPKQTHGYVEYIGRDGQLYLLSPDGKRKFREVVSESSSSASQSVSPKVTPVLAEAAVETKLEKGVLKLFALKQNQEKEGVTDRYSKTYHSALTKQASSSLVAQIVDPSLPFFDRMQLRLDDIITNPDYLSPEIKEMCNGDLSEGNVYYRTKEWVEKNIPGISIDRDFRHKYIWVDDNAFDDLLVTSLKAQTTSDDVSLVDKYNEAGRIPLSKFYNSKQLQEMGIPSDTYVIVAPEVNTETAFTEDAVNGAIFIRSTVVKDGKVVPLTDAEFINRLNHEFRHLLQSYNGFETGFTPSFKVTSEMLADMKKHYGAVFKNDDIVFWAKKAFGNKWQEGIAQRIIYFLIGGEQNAYGYLASDLNTKPAYVDYELGKPTIFMPHYNAETGEGKYTTEFIAMRAEDETDVPKKSSVKKAEKEKKETVKISRIDEQIKQKKKERSEEKRYFSNAKAKGTNLEYFIKPGKDNQLPERLQDFVIATTGNEDKLPPEVMDLISGQYKGTLTMGALMQWFRKADNINDFTFDLLNKYIFKNDYIDSLEDLNKFLDEDPAFYWAAAQIFAQTDISYQYLVEADTTVDEFKERLKTIENYEKFKSSIEKKMADFETGTVDAGTRTYGKELSTHPQAQKYMRVLAMTYFDGTLASAFYVANYFKLVMRLWEGELITSMTSMDSTTSDDEGNTTSLANKLHAGMVEGEKNTGYGNDITALYLANHTFDEDFDVMVTELVAAKFIRLAAEKGITINADDIARASIMRKEHPELEEVLAAVKKYHVKLDRMDPDVVAQLYNKMKFAELVGVEEAKKDIIIDTSTNELSKASRRTIVARIKGKATSLLKLIADGKYKMSSLPDDIQAMFKQETTTSESGKKSKMYVLKPDVYSVGRGKAKLKGQAKGGLLYETQHNIYEGTEVFRHDTSKLVENFEKLSIALKTAQKNVADDRREKKNADRRHTRSQAAGSKTAEFIKKALKEQKHKKSKTSVTPETEGTYTAEFKVGKDKRHLTDTPNNFTIVSPIEMPEVLRKIFDVSFDKFATTEVQYISTDKDGNYYVKKNFKRGEFEGDTVHEVNTLQTFYEANAQTLLNLTRTDVLSIIDFIRHGSVTFDGPSNKYGAFQVFLLAYIIDAARQNSNSWNMSNTEVQNIEKLASNMFSTTGSTMNAISQIQSVIDPYKVTKQAMFNDWDAISEKDKDDFIELTENFEKTSDPEKQVHYAERLQQMLNEFGKRQATEDNKKKYPRWTKSWLNHWYDKAKSYRYLAMLSSPATWLRNVVSNSLVTGLNKTADVVSKFVFENVKGNSYRKDQWDLAGTVVSEEVKQFIDTYVKNNPIFNPDLKDEEGKKNKDAINIYNISGKYDPRQNKEAKNGRSLFVSVIARAYERKYAVEHRFDTKFMNKLSKIIDNMMTDEKFIKFATNRYFAKILTIESGKNKADFAKGKIDLSKGFSSKAMDLFAEAIILANIDYMHKRNFLSDLFDDMRNEHPAMYEALTLWQPFINSSFNWFAEAFKYTPIGLINSIRRACKLEEQIQKIDEKRKKGELVTSSRAVEYLIRRDVGKGIVGALLSVLGMLLASFGLIRIDEEDDKFYVYAGNVKFDISNLFASSSLLVGASIAQAWTSEENGFENVMSRLTDTMLDGFFAVDILDRHRWGGSWEDILSETETVMKSFTPQIIQFLTSLFVRRKIRYSSGLKGVWERYINSWTGGAMGNSVINAYTGEREDKYAIPILEPALAKGLLGPKIYWVDISENERFAREYGVNKAELTGELTVSGSKVMLDRYALNKKYGELNNQSLPKIKSQKHEVKMPDGTYETLSWDDMSKDQRGDVIDRIMSRNADLAKIYMWTNVMGKKYYASDAVYKRLKDAGITQNVYRGDKGFAE